MKRYSVHSKGIHGWYLHYRIIGIHYHPLCYFPCPFFQIPGFFRLSYLPTYLLSLHSSTVIAAVLQLLPS